MTRESPIPHPAQELVETAVAFINEFNPEHPTYHRGDETAVAVGGNRIPTGCEEDQVRRNNREYTDLKKERE